MVRTKCVHHFLVHILWFILFASLTACEQLGLGGKAALPDSTHRVGMAYNIPPSTINKLGNFFYDREIAKQNEKGKIKTDAKIKRSVDRVAENLIAAARKDPRYGDVAKELDWRHETIKAEDPSTAKVFSGGGIAVFEGVFPYVKTEGALAGILAHEMAHILARHEVKRLSALVAAGGVSGGALAFSITNPEKMDPKMIGPVAGALGLGYFFGVNQPWAREQEKEADCAGLSLAAKAGYDPEAITGFWRRMNEMRNEPHTAFDFLKDHPMDDDRFYYIKDQCLAQAKRIYEMVGPDQRQNASAWINFPVPDCRSRAEGSQSFSPSDECHHL